MAGPGEGNHTGGPKSSFIAVLGRHHAVGGHEDRTVKGFEFLPLFPPCIAVVPGKMAVFLKERIVMGRKHFPMSIHVHTGPLCLFQKHLQIFQVMTGNENARIAPYTDIHLCDFRLSIGRRIGFIQKSHALDAVFAGFHGQGEKVIYGKVPIQQTGQRVFKEIVDFPGFFMKNPCMAQVSGKTFQTIGNELTKRPDIFVFFGKYANFRIVIGTIRRLPESSIRKRGLIRQ